MIVALVQVLEHAQKNLRLVVRQVDTANVLLHRPATEEGSEERRVAQHKLVCLEQALFATASNRDNGFAVAKLRARTGCVVLRVKLAK